MGVPRRGPVGGREGLRARSGLASRHLPRFECSRASLGRWIRAYYAGKSLAPNPVRGRPIPKLGVEELERLRQLVVANGDASYERLAELNNVDAAVPVSRSTIMRWVWALGFTWKEKPSERSGATPSASRRSARPTGSDSRSRTKSVSSSSTSPESPSA